MNIDVRNIGYSYHGEKSVLSDVSFRLKKGEVVALLGRNGAGKTTMFRLLLSIFRPENGSILIDGRRLEDIGEKEKSRIISYIPQISEPSFSYSVLESVMMGLAPHLSLFSKPGRKEEQKALEALSILHLEELRNRSISSLSGGERQLCMISRALVQDASFIVLDEPTSSLDYGNQILVLEMLNNLKKRGIGVLYSSHNPELSMRYSDRILILDEGRILFDGSPDSLAEDPDILSDLYKRHIEVRRMEGKEKAYVCIPY